MKNKIIAWLRNGSDFHEGIWLFPSGGIFDNFRRICITQGPTVRNQQMMEYQLCKYAGIPEKDITTYKKSKPVPAPGKRPLPAVKPTVAPHHVPAPPAPDTSPVAEIRKRLRDNYPCLGKPDLPQEIKILVNDMITAYVNYKNSHARLFETKTPAEEYNAARDTVENFILNRQIWEELNYYQDNHRVLGKHPIFTRRKRESEIVRMKVPDLIKLQKQLTMNIWRNTKKIESEPGHEQTQNRAAKIDDYEFELNIVDRLLNQK